MPVNIVVGIPGRMRKLAGMGKLAVAFVLSMGTLFAVFETFDPDQLSESLVALGFVVLAMSVYGYYLVRTGVKDVKDLRYRLDVVLALGLAMHLACCVFAIWKGITVLAMYGTFLPFAALGVVIGIRDAVLMWRWRKEDRRPVAALPIAAGKDELPEMEVDVRIGGKEWVRLVFLATYRKPIVALLSLLGAFQLVAGCYALWGDSGSGLASDTALFQLVLAFVILAVVPFAVWKGAQRQLRSEPLISQRTRYVFTPERFAVSTDGMDISVAWEQVKVMTEAEGWMTIKLNNDRGFYIPVRALDGVQRDGFRAYIRHLKTFQQ